MLYINNTLRLYLFPPPPQPDDIFLDDQFILELLLLTIIITYYLPILYVMSYTIVVYTKY